MYYGHGHPIVSRFWNQQFSGVAGEQSTWFTDASHSQRILNPIRRFSDPWSVLQQAQGDSSQGKLLLAAPGPQPGFL
jgi:hypothetical protein